ncbi:MAG: hypothetical protein LBT46_14275 [Planctomycetaceae bacterium]|nr:hypothetical protein [Planctomycetaceae bacterium]
MLRIHSLPVNAAAPDCCGKINVNNIIGNDPCSKMNSLCPHQFDPFSTAA